ncbi:hypothetical protein C8J56DRAFT_77975 [Mycena floridula]|nr:hypothetical protein C8J56DRAFT_77975 [Mycena floridula]
MASLAAIRASNSSFSPSYLPVAIFVGGTSGIGQAMAENFARYTNGNARIVIIGRNQLAAEETFAKFPKPSNPNASTEFISCDATLMKNVNSVTNEILSRIPKINFLVMSPGFLSMAGREETEEGIDKKLAVHYYARWKFTRELMPALTKASEEGEDAKVFSVLAANAGTAIDLDDLGLKKSYSLSKAASQATAYNNTMVEDFANRNPTVTFFHGHPGVARTNSFQKAETWWLRWSGPLFWAMLSLKAVSATDCAEYMWYGLFNHKKGSFRIGARGEEILPLGHIASEEDRKRLWDHTVLETEK